LLGFKIFPSGFEGIIKCDAVGAFGGSGVIHIAHGQHNLVIKTDIMHIVATKRANPTKVGGAKPPV
jgi:hypothetical protein